MNHLVNGQYLDSDENIDILPDGTAAIGGVIAAAVQEFSGPAMQQCAKAGTGCGACCGALLAAGSSAIGYAAVTAGAECALLPFPFDVGCVAVVAAVSIHGEADLAEKYNKCKADCKPKIPCQ